MKVTEGAFSRCFPLSVVLMLELDANGLGLLGRTLAVPIVTDCEEKAPGKVLASGVGVLG